MRAPLAAAPVLALVLCLAGADRAKAGHPAERGLPLLQHHGPADYHAGTQNRGIAQDPSGVLWFANLAGLLSYDGARWSVQPLPNDSAVFALAVSRDGRVVAGGIDELGFVDADERGRARFTSLLPLVSAADRGFGQVRSILPAGDGMVFVTERALFVWQAGAVRTVARFAPDADPRGFAVGPVIAVRSGTEILALAGDGLSPWPAAAALKGRRVDFIAPGPGGGLVAAVRGAGIQRLADGAVTTLGEEAARHLAEREVSSIAALAHGGWAVGTRRGGLLLLAADGSIEHTLDDSSGLVDADVRSLMLDREGALWLALDTGVARVDLTSPLSVVDARAGLRGTVIGAGRHQGVLWVVSSAGMFTLDGTPNAGAAARARPVAGAASVFGVHSGGDALLIATSDGVVEIGAQGARVLPGSAGVVAYDFLRRPGPVEEIAVATRQGLGILRRDAAQWSWAGLVPGSPTYVRSLAEPEPGVLWCGSVFDGAVRVELAAGAALPSARVSRVGKGEIRVFAAAGAVLGLAGSEILMAAPDGRSLSRHPLTGLVGSQPPYNGVEDAAGRIWLNTEPATIVPRAANGTFDGERRTLVPIPGAAAQMILAEPDGTVWLGNERGLFRHAAGVASFPAAPPALIRRVSAGSEVLFGGSGTAPAAVLSHDFRRLHVEFAPGSYRQGVRYQYRLDPADESWSAPSAVAFVEYTNLAGGSYTLRVRAAGAGGEIGPEAAWSFVVRPPWHRTPWAWALWATCAILAAGAWSRLRGRSLRKHAALLQLQVDARTLELQHTVTQLGAAQAEVVAKNQLLEVANARLTSLSLHDELTGISNRRHLQRELEAEWSRARRAGTSLGFVLADIDFFKSLNDALGHHEGDRCLRAVAQAFESSLPRLGDLASRYGGEEFAILLPATDQDGAIQVAERLRVVVESLDLAHPKAPGGRITASFGAAAMVPDPTAESPAPLVEAADRALYRAKAGGRNRVAAAVTEDAAT